MFTTSNRIVTRGWLGTLASLAILCPVAAVGAQETDGSQDPIPPQEATVVPSTEAEDSATSPLWIDSDSGELAARPWMADLGSPQDGRQGYLTNQSDYTTSNMFGKAHGRFMLDYQRFVPNIALWGGGQSSTGLSGEQGKFSLWEFGAVNHGKIVSDPDSFMTYGGILRIRDYDFDAVTGIPDMRLYNIFLDMGGGRFFSDDVLIEAHFQPGLASDFGGTITSNQWKWFGELIATYRQDESVYWKFGARADNTFEETPVYPVLGVSWLFDSQWRLDVLAPRYIELAWMSSPQMMIRGGLSLQGMDYGYHSTTAAAGTQNDLDARTQEFRAYIDGVWRVDDFSSFSVKIGGTLAGNYDFERPAGAGNYSGQIDPALFFHINFGASF